jgi:hypothetical protein
MKQISQLLGKVIKAKQLEGKFYFKIQTVKTFYERIYSILFNDDYFSKFFIELSQYSKYDKKLGKVIFKG